MTTFIEKHQEYIRALRQAYEQQTDKGWWIRQQSPRVRDDLYNFCIIDRPVTVVTGLVDWSGKNLGPGLQVTIK